jgi:hypothetical protein
MLEVDKLFFHILGRLPCVSVLCNDHVFHHLLSLPCDRKTRRGSMFITAISFLIFLCIYNLFSIQMVNRSVISALAVYRPESNVPKSTEAGCPVWAGGFPPAQEPMLAPLPCITSFICLANNKKAISEMGAIMLFWKAGLFTIFLPLTFPP